MPPHSALIPDWWKMLPFFKYFNRRCHMRWITGFYNKNNIRLGIFVCMVIAISLNVNAAQDWPNYLGPNSDFQPELKEFTATSAEEVWRV